MSDKPRHIIRPYGDRKDDGGVQLSFVLPVPASEKAKAAAAEFAKKFGMSEVLVAAMEPAAQGYTFFVVYGRTHMYLDFDSIDVPEVVVKKKGFDELNAYIDEHVGRRIKVLGACTGSDAHAVGIDAIMNMKGYAGDYGLERYPGFEAKNLGAQVENARLAALVKSEHADAVLVSQVVTQRDVHKDNARDFIEHLKREGVHGKVIALLGGPRIDHKLALELGYDAGFGSGTKPSEVANFIVGAVLNKMGKEMH
jgi:beta-lysine 5,6-aminomutase beta subunit